MPDPRQKRVLCATPSGFHHMAYTEWGDAANPRVLVCVHGLSRSGRDFDELAATLSSHYRVVCPDAPGRGESDWLANPLEYAVPTYANNMVTLFARLGVEEVHWVGTSMGGLIGMALAALPKSPIRRLVLNDVGPLVTAVSLARIATYLGKAPTFARMEEAIAYVKTVSAPFGPHSDAQWRKLTESVVRPAEGGGLRMHYDPAIAVPFAAATAAGGGKDMDLWPMYDAIGCPTLLLRGAQSDLLTADTAEAMTRRGPKAGRIDFPGVGHAPTLMHADQIGAVRDFLLGA